MRKAISTSMPVGRGTGIDSGMPPLPATIMPPFKTGAQLGSEVALAAPTFQPSVGPSLARTMSCTL
jgi:hypothetical protein